MSLRVLGVPLQSQHVPRLVFQPEKPDNSWKDFQPLLTSPARPTKGSRSFCKSPGPPGEVQRRHLNGLGTIQVARTPISPEPHSQIHETTTRALCAVLHVFTRERIQVDSVVQHVMRRTAPQGCHQLMRKPHDDALDICLRVVDPRLRCLRAWPETVTQEFRPEVSARIFASISNRQALAVVRETILNSAFS